MNANLFSTIRCKARTRVHYFNAESLDTMPTISEKEYQCTKFEHDGYESHVTVVYEGLGHRMLAFSKEQTIDHESATKTGNDSP